MEPHEIDDLISRWTQRLLLFACQWTDFGEDAVQEAFLNLYRSKTRPDDVVAWLFRATRNAALNIRRTEASKVRLAIAAGQTAPKWFEPSEGDRLDIELVTEELRKLPPELSEVVTAKIWGGLTFEQVAAATGTSRATAHRRYNDAIATLRTRLKVDE